MRVAENLLNIQVIIQIGKLSYFTLLLIVVLIEVVTAVVGIISSKLEMISPKTQRESKGEEQKSFYMLKKSRERAPPRGGLFHTEELEKLSQINLLLRFS